MNPNKDDTGNEESLPETKVNEDEQQHAGHQMQTDQNEKALTSASLKELPQTGESNNAAHLPIIYTLLSAGILVLWKFKNK
ncbi:LPXTG cell wall anchor domain-containing protein [Staphylococcus intermedius]|uniref:LPXTG cell wall anchor domain-containing protein n=1 Tax=Staphylococcus intermedius TaxID=1285 RepID=UPI000BBBCD44|nr:LPXTG cell wall anchor domain-containing protein [Staphylococcus intermedius]